MLKLWLAYVGALTVRKSSCARFTYISLYLFLSPLRYDVKYSNVYFPLKFLHFRNCLATVWIYLYFLLRKGGKLMFTMLKTVIYGSLLFKHWHRLLSFRCLHMCGCSFLHVYLLMINCPILCFPQSWYGFDYFHMYCYVYVWYLVSSRKTFDHVR